MERRRALIVAATTSLTLLAGAGAVSLNTSLVSGSGDDGVGEISPIDATIPRADVGADPCVTTTVPGVSTNEDRVPGSTGDEDHCAGADAGGRDQGIEDAPGAAYEQEYEYEGAEDDD